MKTTKEKLAQSRRYAKRRLVIEVINHYEAIREAGTGYKSALKTTLIDMRLANRKDYD